MAQCGGAQTSQSDPRMGFLSKSFCWTMRSFLGKLQLHGTMWRRTNVTIRSKDGFLVQVLLLDYEEFPWEAPTPWHNVEAHKRHNQIQGWVSCPSPSAGLGLRSSPYLLVTFLLKCYTQAV